MSLLLSPRSLVTRLQSAYAANPGRIRLAFVAMLALVVVGMSLKYAAKVSKPADNGQLSRSAFLRWRAMIHEVFEGANIYVGVHEYPNPPIMAVVLKPFADLPPIVGALTWFYAKVLMAVLAAVWVFRLVSPPGQDIPDSAKAVALLLSLSPLLGDLSHNNVNIFILFLVVGCLEAYRRGRDGLAGVVLGLAIACKVTPLMFVAYFAYKRAWRALAGCAVGLILWLAVVPGTVYGWGHNAELLDSWYELMVRPAIVENRVTSEHPNQSIPGVVFRLLTRSPSFLVYPDNIPTPAAFHNLADIGTDAARWVVKGSVVAFGVLILVLCRAPKGERQGWRFAAECSLIVIGMLLFSERTWKHHAVTLLVPFAVLAWAVFSDDTSRRMKRWLVGVLVAVGVLTNLSGALSDHAADLAMVYGCYTAAFVLLTAAVCGLLATPRGAGAGHR